MYLPLDEADLGIVLSVVAIMLTLPPLIEAWKSRRDQIRSVSASLDPIGPTGGGYTECRLVVTNGSRWTVRHIVLVRPKDIQADFTSIGPGESRRTTVNAPTTEWHPITMQITDARGTNWWWTPELDTPVATRTSPSLSAVAHLVQFILHCLPNRCTSLFLRLSKPVLIALWGYDPEGIEGGSDTLERHLAEVKRALGWAAGKEKL